MDKNKKLILINIIALSLASIFLLWGILHALDNYTQHDKAQLAPDLKGLTSEEALAQLNKINMRGEVIDSIYTREVPAGAIVDQVPQANSKIKQGRIFFLTVNARSHKMVPVPDTDELSQRQAIATLKGAGFKVDSIIYVDYPFRDLAVGVHYNHQPIFTGEKIPSGSSLSLLVGNGNSITQEVDTDSISSEEPYLEEEWFE